MSALGSYAGRLGMIALDDGTCLLPFGPNVEGRPGQLHGGAVAAMLEIAARHALGTEPRALRLITMTIDFLRPGLPVDSYAAGTIVRRGRRIAHVEARAWQDDPARPIGLARLTIRLEDGA